MKRDDLHAQLNVEYDPILGYGLEKVDQAGYENIWFIVVERFHSSGLSKTSFCRQNNISISRFYELVKKFGDGEIPSTKARSNRAPTFSNKHNFIELQAADITEVTPSIKILRITTSYGTIVEIPL